MQLISGKKAQHQMVALLRYAEMLGLGELTFKIDHATGLHAMIAVHSTQRGPAIGGCRLIHYDHPDEAIIDVLRLAQMMSYKAAVCNLPHGGAKSVIIKPKFIKDREAFFTAYGDFVDQQQGRYVTAVDSGTEPADMDIIAKRTRYVTCTSFGGYAGDPSPLTALGVRRGIEVAVLFALGRNTLSGVHVAIQGAGHVGYWLAKELIALGAQISMCDANPVNLQKCVDELRVTPIHSPNAIYELECDVFAPCALGAILRPDTIAKLKAKIVAGSANNQLAHHHHDAALQQRGILYVPDFVINAGGLIHAAAIYDHQDAQQAHQQIYNLYDTLMNLFIRSKDENRPTNEIAEVIAKENLGMTHTQH